MPRKYFILSLALLLAAGAPAAVNAGSSGTAAAPSAQSERPHLRAADAEDDDDLPTLEDYAQYGGPSEMPAEPAPKEGERAMTEAQYGGPQRRLRSGQGLLALCGPDGERIVERMIERTERLTRPTDAQRPALDKLKQAALKAHEAGKDACPTERFASLPLRFADMEKRLTARLNAVRILRPAIEEFYATLSDEQKARLNMFGTMRAMPQRSESEPRGNRRDEPGSRRGENGGWPPGWRGRL